MSEMINLREYSYDQEMESVVRGKVLTDLMQFLEVLIKKETSYRTYIESFPSKVEPKTVLHEDEEVLEAVEVEWTDYPNAQSFFNQTPIKTVSELGAMAIDMKMRLDAIHFSNIESGLATKNAGEL